MARADPWAQFADAPEELEQPDQQAMGVAPPPAVPDAAAPPPETDPFAQFGDESPAPLVDTGGTIMFDDEMPEQAASKLEAADEADLLRILQTGTAADARKYAASKGFGGADNFEEVVSARDKGLGVNSGIEYDLPQLPDRGAGEAFTHGLGDIPTFGTLDELGAVVDSLGGTEGRENIWKSDRSVKDVLFANIDVNRGLLQGDAENHPVARLAGQIIGGLPIPSGLRGVALKAGTQALREGRTLDEARKIAAVAARNRTATVGGGTGAAYGFGSGEGTPLERVDDAAIGGAVGTAGGAAVGAVGQVVAPRVAAKAAAARAAPIPAEQKFVDAAERQGIEFIAADVPNATKSRFATAVAGVTLGGIPLAERAEQVITSAKAARDALAGRVGVVADKTGAGQAAQRGAREWMKTTEGRGQQLEQLIPIAPEARVTLAETRDKLKYLTTGLKSNSALSRLWAENPRLKKTLDALTPKENKATGELEGGELSWKDMRRFRSIVGQIIGQPGLQSDGATIDGLRQLYGALSADMRVTAAEEGERALTAFNRVNQFWRGREDRIGSVLADILGKDNNKGAQPAFEAIQRLANLKGGDAVKLARTLRSLPDDEANTARATVLHQMGTVSKGRNDVTGEVFSPADFATHWNALDPRARSVLFQGQHAKDLTDIATVADGMKSASKFANTSKTGIATTALGTISSGFANPLLPFLIGSLQFGGGKLLASPKMAHWAAAATRKPNPAASLVHLQGLTKIARSEPAIANEVLGLQQRLAETFTSAPARLAADEGLDHSAEVNGQDQQ